MDSWQREFLIVLMSGDYNYLARNAGGVLYAFPNEPKKFNTTWSSLGTSARISDFEHDHGRFPVEYKTGPVRIWDLLKEDMDNRRKGEKNDRL